MIDAHLVLADGSVFEGALIGASRSEEAVAGEVVFNTSMTGYQEIITDPSYAGQIISFTSTHIGNYGLCADDDESASPRCRGVIVRDVARRTSSHRSTESIQEFLERHDLQGLTGVDTRRLTRHIRSMGAMPGAFGTGDVDGLRNLAVRNGGTDGQDLVSQVTTTFPYEVAGTNGAGRFIVAYDFGIKSSILRQLSCLGRVEVVPANTPADEVLARQPDGVFLSNGPGDPAAVIFAPDIIAGLLGQVPVFGICLGHQLLATALGAETYKLPFGHHGGNHPVRDLSTQAVEITSQNHNYAVADTGSVAFEVTHRNLNDDVVEGIRALDAQAFSVQYHPEAGPGPHDARHLFARFSALIDEGR